MKKMPSLAQRISCESIGHSVGAVPFRSWLSCVRNLDKSKEEKLALEQENSKRRCTSSLAFGQIVKGRDMVGKIKWSREVAK